MTRAKRTPGAEPQLVDNIVGLRAKQGRRVEVFPGVTAFRDIRFSAGLRYYTVEGRLVLDDPPSAYLLDSLTVRRPRGSEAPFPTTAKMRRQIRERARPVTSEGLRTVALEHVTAFVLNLYGVESVIDKMTDEDVAQLRAAGLKDEAALGFVTAVYLEASLRGLAPAGWVAHRLDCSAATAGRWIAAAKDAGFLTVADTRRR
jgi:hypothetical protein